MIKNFDRIPLSSIQLTDEPVSPFKPHIKILRRKLPQDFFIGRHGIHSSTAVVRSIQRQPPTTSSFPRKILRQDQMVREALTARDSLKSNDQQLIMGVLKSAREMKKVFRKHSVELRKQQLPRKKVNQFDLQLPPLLLKKGITTAL